MADDNVETSAPIATENVSDIVRPEYVQEKFWDTNTNKVNLENLASSYNSLETKLGSRTEDLTKQIRTDIENEKNNNVPENYKLNVPEMENTSLTISEEMPIVKWWGETAKNAGLSQEQYDTGVQAFIDNAVANLPNVDMEIQKLGDSGKDRVDAAAMWSKKNLTPEAYSVMSGLAATADGVKALEEIMALNKDTAMPSTPTQVDMSATADDLKSMLNDPRYYDSSRRDPSYVKRVTELYEKAYGKTDS
tara:strand:+ start:2091 stop:2837 length:747 start_codon:yes stop_codon:yes gene_type:complete